jgi:REP element-mobilizing transposase RayT
MFLPCFITQSARPNIVAPSLPMKWKQCCAVFALTSATATRSRFWKSAPIRTMFTFWFNRFRRVPSVKRELWGGAFWSRRCVLVEAVRFGRGGAFWSSGYYIDTVGRHGSEEAIRNYVAGQGRQQEYRQLHLQPLEPPDPQLELF